jgi:hypothetical protein
MKSRLCVNRTYAEKFIASKANPRHGRSLMKIMLLPGSNSETLEIPINGEPPRMEDIKQTIEREFSKEENIFASRQGDILKCYYPTNRPINLEKSKERLGCIFDLDAYNREDRNLRKEISEISKAIYIGYISLAGSRFVRMASEPPLDFYPDPLKEDLILDYLNSLSARIEMQNSLNAVKGKDDTYKKIYEQLVKMKKDFYIRKST